MQPERQPERPAARRDPPPGAGLLAAPKNPVALVHDPDSRPRHDARELTQGGNAAEIRLDGVRYVLRITRQGKLILTK